MKVKLVLTVALFCYLLGTGFKQACAFQHYSANSKTNILSISVKQEKIETLLSDSTVNDIKDFSENELLKKEIQRLNKDLDTLQANFNNLQKENLDLKLTIKQYDNKENLKKQRSVLINKISQESREAKAYYDNLKIPDLYITAQNLLIIGNIDVAITQLQEFISKTVKELNKSKKNKLDNVKKFFLAYSNYWLGRINNINGNYTEAVKYFSESYKITTDNKLSLISLIGLIESLTNLYKDSEACIAVKQFNNDYAEASKDKKFQLDKLYIDLVTKFSAKNKC